jgi:hypothetical protein
MRTIIVIGILFCGLAKADMICKPIGDGEVLCRTVTSAEAPKEESTGRKILKAFAAGLRGMGQGMQRAGNRTNCTSIRNGNFITTTCN